MMKQNRLFKTLFVLVLVVLGYTNMQAQNGNIQFADSHVKEICVQNWDTNGDGELSYDEAAAVTSLSNALFQGNEDITSFDELQYFTGITEIPYSSFMQCVNLTSVILPPNVHDIETMAFFGCTSLTSVYLHDQVVNVGANAWSGCSSVSSVYIGANVATFNVNPFGEMTNLEAFDVSPDNVTFASIDGLLMTADGTSLIQYPAGKHDVEFVIGSSITQVGGDAFRGCAYLKKLTVTQNSQVSTNDNNSYWYITSLEEVVFNEGIQEIGANSFMGCSSLTTIHFPSTLTYLGSSSFSGCNAINKIYSDVVTPFSFTDDVFTDDVYHYADVVVPDGSKPAYKETAGWSNFQCFQTDTPVVTNPEPYAVLSDNNSILTFYYDEKKTERNGMNIASVGYPSWYDQRESITKVIFDDTFANCTTLTSTSMWFYGCSFLTEIVGISNLKTDNVTDMGLMFRECPKLTALDVSGFNTENVTSMNAMFFGCSSLTSLDVSNFNTSNVTYMGLMFGSCSGLTSLDVTNFNMEKVNVVTEMFEDCTGLKTLDISNFNTGNAFQMESMFIGCSNLETIYVDSNWSLHPNTEGHFMFEGCTSLVGGKGTVFDFDHRDQEYARIDGGPNSTTPGYFTDKNAIVEYALDAEVVAIASGHISISSVMDTEGMWSESYHYKLTINPDNNPKVVANAVASPASLDYFQFNWYGGYLFVGNYTGVSANIDAGVLKSNFQKLTITPTNIENLVDGATYTFKLTAYETVQNTEVARRETTISLTKLMPTEANLLTFRPNQETTDGSGEVISYMTPNKQGTIANAYAPFADNNFAPSQTTAEIEACYDARDAKASNGFKNLSNIFYNLSVNGQNGYNSGTYDENEWDKTFEFMFGTSNADGTSALVDANGKGISFAHPQGLQTSQKYMLEIPAELIDGTTKHTLDIYKVYPGISTELNNDGSVHHFNEDYPVANGQHLNFTYACWHHANTFAWESPDKTPQLQWSSAGSEGTAPFTDIVSMNTYDPDYFGNGTATGKTLANLTAKYFLTGFDNVQLNSMADGTGQINSYYIPSIDGETITFTQASTQAAAAPDADHTEYLIITAKDAFNHDVRIVLDVQIKVPVVTDPEPYAALSDNNTVLIFYYDDKKTERNGMDVGPFSQASDRGWANVASSITKVVFDDAFEDYKSLTSTAFWFDECSDLTEIFGLDKLRTLNVTDMNCMFYGCHDLSSLDVSNFKTDNVTNMSYMFNRCSGLTSLDVSNFKTDNVTSMSWMFHGCDALTSLDVSGFKTDNVTSMSWMFQGCDALTSLDVSGFKTDNVTDMSNMFGRCIALTTLDVSNFNTSNVTNMSGMFSYCYKLENLDVSGFKTDKVTNMSEMFIQCYRLTNLDVSKFNTDNVTNMSEMFSYCSDLTSLDLSSFKTDNVTNMGGMFMESFNLRTIFVGEGWNTANINGNNGIKMFSNCMPLVGGKGTAYNPDHVDYTYARIDGGPNSQTPGYFTKKGDAPWVEPNALVLTGKIDNYWYDEAGNPDGFEAIIINVPLPPGEVSIWESNVLNTFIENKLAFTTQNGEPVDNVEGRVLFTEKGHWKTIDGGRILVYEDANMQGEVAEIDPEWGMIRILNTDVTWSLLSATDRYVSLPLCVKAYIGDDEMPLTNGSFTVLATKPLSIESISHIEISFENSQEVSVPLDELIHLQDWRNKQLVRNDSPDLYEYYRVDSPMITGTENGEELNKIIMTDLGSSDGSLHSLSEMAPDLAVSYNPDLNHGMLTFVNNGGQLGSFTIFVPVTINHEWGYLSGQVIIKVHEGDMPVDAEPYAVLSNNNTVLTFYYDDKKAERNGMDVESFGLEPGNMVNSGWFGQRENITNVVFDDSFANCTDLEGSAYWFWECSNLTSVTGITNLKTDNMTQMLGMFGWCSNLTTLDVSHFNTEKNTRLDGMFTGCSKLTSIDVSGFNTSNVTDMGEMFMGCSSLTSIDVSNFNTSNVTRLTGMFQGCSSLTTLDLSNFLTTQNPVMELMFEGCTSLASIQAGNAEIPAEEYANIGNPNLLVYVNEARLAPEGVQNVVVNGVAKEIVLTDNPDGKIVNNNWYCPEPFRAEKISYTRDFRQQTQIGVSRGWESLALPFAVQTITHQDKGVIAPFGSDASGLHFWLRRLGHEGLISVQMIEPNTPYIISMPNSEDYASRFNLNGRVTFAAEDAYVERTEQMEDESADYMMVPAFQRMPVSEYVYALNVGEERNGRPEGSIFERNYREVRPFEAYTLHRGDQPAPLFFDLSDLEDSTTDIPDVRWMMDDGNGEWYDLQGRKLGSTLNVQRSTLKKGVYIRNGRKVVFK